MSPTSCHRHRRRAVRVASLALVVTFVAALGAAPALGQEAVPGGDGSFGVEPGDLDGGESTRDYFVYQLAPGQGLVDSVAVTNQFDRDMTFSLLATDAFQTPETGAFGLLAEEEEPADVGTWITLRADEYTIPPGQTANIPFSIVVPPDATPGDHIGGIVATPIEALAAPDDGNAVALRYRVGARVYVRVDGPLTPSLRIRSLEIVRSGGVGGALTGLQDLTVRYEVVNTGNVRMTPQTFLSITGPFGVTLREAEPHQMSEIFPGSAIVVTEELSAPLPLGRLTARVEARQTGGTPAEAVASKGFFAVPWALVIVLLLVGGFLALRAARRRGGGAAAPVAPAPPAPTPVEPKEPVPV